MYYTQSFLPLSSIVSYLLSLSYYYTLFLSIMIILRRDLFVTGWPLFPGSPPPIIIMTPYFTPPHYYYKSLFHPIIIPRVSILPHPRHIIIMSPYFTISSLLFHGTPHSPHYYSGYLFYPHPPALLFATKT